MIRTCVTFNEGQSQYNYNPVTVSVTVENLIFVLLRLYHGRFTYDTIAWTCHFSDYFMLSQSHQCLPFISHSHYVQPQKRHYIAFTLSATTKEALYRIHIMCNNKRDIMLP